MKNILIALIFSVVGMGYSQNVLIPQQNASSSFNSDGRWGLGGNIGLSIDSEILDIQIAPRISYQFVRNLEFALNVSYTYRRADIANAQIFGIGPELTYVYNGLVVGTSYQYVMSSINSKLIEKSINQNESALFFNAGYRFPIGNRTYTEMGVRYNVLYRKGSSVFSSGFMPYAGVTVSL